MVNQYKICPRILWWDYETSKNHALFKYTVQEVLNNCSKIFRRWVSENWQTIKEFPAKHLRQILDPALENYESRWFGSYLNSQSERKRS